MKFRIKILLFLVLLLSFILRFYQLGQIPPSLDWDEASLGWNALSLAKTGSDEYGNVLPISIRSFNDYKPPVYVYTLIPVVTAFGLTEWAVRLPSALAGIGSIVLTYFLVNELTKNRKLSLLSCFLFAICPWAINFSRVAFEANLALFFFIAGATFLARKSLYLAALFFVLSMYSYHSTRLVVPLFVLGIFLCYRRTFLEKPKQLILALIISAILLVPLSYNLVTNTAQARFSQVGIFSASGAGDSVKKYLDLENEYKSQDLSLAHNKYLNLGKIFAKNYLDHFNLDFLFLTGDNNPRHHAPDVGMLLLVELPFILLGGFTLVSKRPKYFWFLLTWFVCAPVASSLTTETPHAVRSLLFLPIYQIVGAIGLLVLLKSLKSLKILKLLISLFFIFNFFYFSNQYFVQMPVEYAESWQYGYKQLVSFLHSKNQPAMITLAYDQPYIYFLFYDHPLVKNDGSFADYLDNYKFVNWAQISDTDKEKIPSNVLQVASHKDLYKIKIITDEIKYPNGKTAFAIGHN